MILCGELFQKSRFNATCLPLFLYIARYADENDPEPIEQTILKSENERLGINSRRILFKK